MLFKNLLKIVGVGLGRPWNFELFIFVRGRASPAPTFSLEFKYLIIAKKCKKLQKIPWKSLHKRI